MADLNTTIIELIQPYSTTIGSLMNIIKVLVGGFFGLYVVIFIFRIVTFRKINKKLDLLFGEIITINKRLTKMEKKLEK
tara:strand:+ start:6784 stop:7020 length:237 start_codon:yes stop_codon:yes gene_type:complete